MEWVNQSLFSVGTAVGGNARNKAAFKMVYNILVCEYQMKWDQLEPAPGNFNWTSADALAAFAKESGVGAEAVQSAFLPSVRYPAGKNRDRAR